MSLCRFIIQADILWQCVCVYVCVCGGGGLQLSPSLQSNVHEAVSAAGPASPSRQTSQRVSLQEQQTHHDILFLYNMHTGDYSENSSLSQCINSRAEISHLQLVTYWILNPGGVAGKVQENVLEQMKSLCSRWWFERLQVWGPVTLASLPGATVYIHFYMQSMLGIHSSPQFTLLVSITSAAVKI